MSTPRTFGLLALLLRAGLAAQAPATLPGETPADFKVATDSWDYPAAWNCRW